MDTKNEPIRLTNWITAVVTALIGAVVMYLQTNDWRASAIVALTAVGGLVTAGEVGREKVVSPLTLEQKTGMTLDQLK